MRQSTRCRRRNAYDLIHWRGTSHETEQRGRHLTRDCILGAFEFLLDPTVEEEHRQTVGE